MIETAKEWNMLPDALLRQVTPAQLAELVAYRELEAEHGNTWQPISKPAG